MSSLAIFSCMVLGGIVAASGVVLLSKRCADSAESLDAPPAAPHWRALLLVLVGCVMFVAPMIFGR